MATPDIKIKNRFQFAMPNGECLVIFMYLKIVNNKILHKHSYPDQCVTQSKHKLVNYLRN